MNHSFQKKKKNHTWEVKLEFEIYLVVLTGHVEAFLSLCIILVVKLIAVDFFPSIEYSFQLARLRISNFKTTVGRLSHCNGELLLSQSNLNLSQPKLKSIESLFFF